MTADFPLSSLEVKFCLGVWAVHALGAFVLTWYTASVRLHPWLQYWTEPSDLLPPGYQMDNSDLEWRLYRLSLPSTIVALSLHSILFHFVVRYFPQRFGSIVLVVFWTAMHCYLASVSCVLILAIYAAAVTAISWHFRRQWISWVFTAIFLVKGVPNWLPFSTGPVAYYREFGLYLYTAIQVLNFNIWLCRQPQKPLEKDGAKNDDKRTVKQPSTDCSTQFPLLLDFLLYLLYPPYSTALIVLFDDFRAQMGALRAKISAGERRILPPPMQLLWRALRLLFWATFLDVVLCFARANTFFHSPFFEPIGEMLNNYEVAAIAYTAGQLFHVKYTVIFGVQRWFASVNGLEPPGSPICISRVSRYSKMWRYFDRGLYQFLKRQAYIPLMSALDELRRKGPGNQRFFHHFFNNQTIWLLLLVQRLAPMLAVFAIVLVWHGPNQWNYFCWVALSALGLSLERFGAGFLTKTHAFRVLEKQLGEAGTLRLKAVAMLATVIPGIFGIFFFLGHSPFGALVFRRVLVDGLRGIFWELRVGWMTPGGVLAHLLLLGYCFNIACLWLEHRFNNNRPTPLNDAFSEKGEEEKKKD